MSRIFSAPILCSTVAKGRLSFCQLNAYLLTYLLIHSQVLGVPIDENNVPQIDRAVSPLPSSSPCPAVSAHKQPVYPRRFASLRLPSGRARSVGCRHPVSSTLLSPAASAANSASDHHQRALSGSYARIQLLQNIGKT